MINIQKIDHLDDMNNDDFTAFMQAGLVYIKLPKNIKSTLVNIRQQALDFFHLPAKVKDHYPMQNGDGYLDQSKKTIAQIQRYIYRHKIVAPMLEPMEEEFIVARKYLAQELFKPILDKIFSELNLQKHLAEFGHDMDQTLSLIFYPAIEKSDERLQAHQDLAAITALWAPEPGLETRVGEKWGNALCDEDYIALQLGRAVQLATNNQCTALEHRVSLVPNKERFSIASFYVPNKELSFTNYCTGEVIFDNFGGFITQELQKTYPEN